MKACLDVKKTRFETRESTRYVLDHDTMKEILDRFPDGSSFRLPILVGYYSGLRIAEIFGPTWDNIDFEDKTLTVEKILVKHDKDWYIGTPKTRSSVRTIKIGDTLLSELKRERSRQLENEMYYSTHYTCQYAVPETNDIGDKVTHVISQKKAILLPYDRIDFICKKENGELLTQESFKYASRVIRLELGIQFNFHSLRHTHATLLIENRADVKDVQMRLGHNNIETTLNTYVHDTDSMKENTVEIFERLCAHK